MQINLIIVQTLNQVYMQFIHSPMHNQLIRFIITQFILRNFCIVCTYGSVSEKMSLRYIWDRFREKGPSAYYKICYTNALCLNRCNSRTVHAIDFLFSTRHTTPFQYVKLYFGVLHKLRADVTRFDSPWGLKTPHLQVGASKSF